MSLPLGFTCTGSSVFISHIKENMIPWKRLCYPFLYVSYLSGGQQNMWKKYYRQRRAPSLSVKWIIVVSQIQLTSNNPFTRGIFKRLPNLNVFQRYSKHFSFKFIYHLSFLRVNKQIRLQKKIQKKVAKKKGSLRPFFCVKSNVKTSFLFYLSFIFHYLQKCLNFFLFFFWGYIFWASGVPRLSYGALFLLLLPKRVRVKIINILSWF